jgi:hypothetical protein
VEIITLPLARYELRDNRNMNVHVECYSGRKADERWVRFRLDADEYTVEVLDQWYGPNHISSKFVRLMERFTFFRARILCARASGRLPPSESPVGQAEPRFPFWSTESSLALVGVCPNPIRGRECFRRIFLPSANNGASGVTFTT